MSDNPGALKPRGAVRIEVGIGVDSGELITISPAGESAAPAHLSRAITKAEHLAGKAGHTPRP